MEPPKEEVLQMENFVARLTAAAHRQSLQGRDPRRDSPSNRLLHSKIPASTPSQIGSATPLTFL